MAARGQTRRRRRNHVILAVGVGLALWRELPIWWHAHPVYVALTGLALAGTVAGTTRLVHLYRWRKGQETDLYNHFLKYVRPGAPLYYGISNDYALRCQQHAEDSWWWPLVDWELSTKQTFPNRALALAAEAAAIRRDCPIGNTAHNWRYAAQTTEREQLQALAIQILAARQPAPTYSGGIPAYGRN